MGVGVGGVRGVSSELVEAGGGVGGGGDVVVGVGGAGRVARARGASDATLLARLLSSSIWLMTKREWPKTAAVEMAVAWCDANEDWRNTLYLVESRPSFLLSADRELRRSCRLPPSAMPPNMFEMRSATTLCFTFMASWYSPRLSFTKPVQVA